MVCTFEMGCAAVQISTEHSFIHSWNSIDLRKGTRDLQAANAEPGLLLLLLLHPRRTMVSDRCTSTHSGDDKTVSQSVGGTRRVAIGGPEVGHSLRCPGHPLLQKNCSSCKFKFWSPTFGILTSSFERSIDRSIDCLSERVAGPEQTKTTEGQVLLQDTRVRNLHGGLHQSQRKQSPSFPTTLIH